MYLRDYVDGYIITMVVNRFYSARNEVIFVTRFGIISRSCIQSKFGCSDLQNGQKDELEIGHDALNVHH